MEKKIGSKKKEKLMIVYFAHPINTYNTDIESQCLELIQDKFGDNIMNPSDDLIQKHLIEYRKDHPNDYMKFFENLLSECNIIVYLPFKDGMIGAGVWFECKIINEKGGDIYEIDLENGTISEIDFGTVDMKKLTVEETRIRIKKTYYYEN